MNLQARKHHSLINIGIPCLTLAFPIIWYGLFGSNVALIEEEGIIENATVLYLVIAIFCFIKSQFIKNPDAPSLIRGWLVVLTLGAVYFAGEEVSWGQHAFGWATGGAWGEVNDQNETNLHNTSALLDQLPRTLLVVGIIAGGIVIPLIIKIRKIDLDQKTLPYWLLPTFDGFAAALLVVLARPIIKITQIEFFSAGEMKECAIALFIMIYGISLYRRLQPTEN